MLERHYPKLIQNLVGVVSPLRSWEMGRFLKETLGAGVKVIYISSCIAAKFEIYAEETQGAIDILLTYRELEGLFRGHATNIASLKEEPFDGIPPRLGRLFPISGGQLKAFSIATDPLDTEIVTTEGEVNVMGVIRDLAQGRITPRITDIRFCV